MNKARTRVILAFIILVLIQIACGCEVNHEVAAHIYQDLNGNRVQDSDEPDFPGIEVSSDKDQRYLKTNNSGDVTVGSQPLKDCSDYWPRVFIPSGYTRTENDRSPASWDFSSVLLNISQCPRFFAHEKQKGDWTVGLQPKFEMTKTPNPTSFSAPGETITYTYLINNTTDNDFSQVSVTDDKTTVTCPAETVAAGESMTCTATYSTNEQDVAQGSITNTAQFTATVTLLSYGGQEYNLNITSAPVSATVALETAQDVEVTCECDGTTEVCSDGTSTENAVACQPQEPALSGPLLTGEVLTLCDTVNRPVNLRLVAGADTALISSELADGNLRVSIGGTDISNTCAVNPSNTTLLTCTYPAGISSYPAAGVVTYNGNQIDTFDFNGENGCQPASNGNTSNGDTSNGETTNEQPAACVADPSSFECSCALDPGSDPDCPQP